MSIVLKSCCDALLPLSPGICCWYLQSIPNTLSVIQYLLTHCNLISDAKYQKLMSQLCNVEYQADKTWLVRQMAVREQDRYDSLHKEIGMYVWHSVTFIGLG